MSIIYQSYVNNFISTHTHTHSVSNIFMWAAVTVITTVVAGDIKGEVDVEREENKALQFNLHKLSWANPAAGGARARQKIPEKYRKAKIISELSFLKLQPTHCQQAKQSSRNNNSNTRKNNSNKESKKGFSVAISKLCSFCWHYILHTTTKRKWQRETEKGIGGRGRGVWQAHHLKNYVKICDSSFFCLCCKGLCHSDCDVRETRGEQ